MTNPKRVLLVGSSFSASPIFFALKRLDLHVSVCGSLKTDPCHQYADESFYIDYSKPEDLLILVGEQKFDYIVPSCNDYAYMSCAFVAEQYGYSGFDKLDIASTLHNKSKFREAAEKFSISAPKFMRIKERQNLDIGDMKFPLLVKPVDSFSGRGMTKISDFSSLQQAVLHAVDESRSGEVVLEEFIDGALHSHSAFIEDKEIALDFFADEFCTMYPYQVNCSNHPSGLSERTRSAVREEVMRLINSLELNNGLLHTQFIVSGETVWIIECMRRCPGDLYGSMIELSTGVNYADLYIRSFIEQRLPPNTPIYKHKYFGRHTVSRNSPLINFSFSNKIPSVRVEIVPLKGSGERLKEAPFDKLAIIFAEFNDQNSMLTVTPNFADLIDITELGCQA
ncbi:ATP-grasp domain-containing protein [Pseudomonas sp. Fl4BN1]|uniref:ATP-grasp domain-containing protein n=1 Tax=Pseudomonas sp. Fl4BN1 TaxID=2697651 RepID=UPI00137848B2|nr:ATP-grasp domain-containing protein [Pseudomonas sp. Fl4BN1]NBF09329.1 ATP-grasp domain-containing protein [Pseudomonas sp. Fl4BN1]